MKLVQQAQPSDTFEKSPSPKHEMSASSQSPPTRLLPPYSYVPGHEHPHPVTDPRGHLYGQSHPEALPPEALARLPAEPTSRRRALDALLAKAPAWLYALDLFNRGYYWEAHEAWEGFWNQLGRTTPEAKLVQGLIHLAAACVKIREGRAEGVKRHTQRAAELLGQSETASLGVAEREFSVALGLDSNSIARVLLELDRYRPECWHTSRTPVVRVVAEDLRLAEP